ncbi:MAG: hypothetical protein FJ280_30185 [Planctomycetes bacterium]|nr:hypothetical protein [Planctomycetota bacterium]
MGVLLAQIGYQTHNRSAKRPLEAQFFDYSLPTSRGTTGICIVAVIGLCISEVNRTFEKEGTGWGICVLLGAPIAFCILAGISIGILWAIFHVITFPIFYFLRRKETARYEAKCATLHSTLSEVTNKRSQCLNTWGKEAKKTKKGKLRQKTPIADELERMIGEIEEDEEQ